MLDTTVLGLPLDAWLLIAASSGIGLGLELLFLRAQRLHARHPGDGGGGGDAVEEQP